MKVDGCNLVVQLTGIVLRSDIVCQIVIQDEAE
jgi:hypothetical protein